MAGFLNGYRASWDGRIPWERNRPMRREAKFGTVTRIALMALLAFCMVAGISLAVPQAFADDEMDTTWQQWDSDWQSSQTFNFSMNGLPAKASVKKPIWFADGNKTLTKSDADSIRTQFQVALQIADDASQPTKLTDYSYLYKTSATNGKTSGVAAVVGTAQKVVWVPFEVSASAEFFYSSNAVMERIPFSIDGQDVVLEQTVFFSSTGIVQTTTYTNASNAAIANFGILTKIDTQLNGNDAVPVHYGDTAYGYYLHDDSGKVQRDLYVTADTGITGALATKATKVPSITASPAVFKPEYQAWGHATGDVAYPDANASGTPDSEILYATAQSALGVGQSVTSSYTVNLKTYGKLTVHYVEKDLDDDDTNNQELGHAAQLVSGDLNAAGNDTVQVSPVGSSAVTETTFTQATAPVDIDGYHFVGSSDDTLMALPESTQNAQLYLYYSKNQLVTLHYYDASSKTPDVALKEETTDVTASNNQIALAGLDDVAPRAGYTARGWTLENTASNPETFLPASISYDFSVFKRGTTTSCDLAANTCDVTVYVAWYANEGSLIFDGNGADSGSVAAMSVKTDQQVSLPEGARDTSGSGSGATAGFERDGYFFTGWNSEKDGSGTAYKPGDSFTVPPLSGDTDTPAEGSVRNVTFYAQWEKAAVALPLTGDSGIPLTAATGIAAALLLAVVTLAAVALYRRRIR